MATIPDPNNFVRILVPLRSSSDMTTIQNSEGGDALSLTDVTDALGFTPLNKSGDSITGSLSFSNEPGTALKIDNGYGWHDLVGNATPRPQGLDAPSLAEFRGIVTEYAYNVNDVGDLRFHIPHDYLPNSNMFIHVHWGHNGTNISGTFAADFTITYAKGHQQALFDVPVVVSLIVPNLSIANTPQYMHRVDEVQMSTVGGSANLIDSSLIEPDGILLIHFTTSIIPSISNGTMNRPFVFTVDIHYQSTSLPTKNKSPNFYS